MDERLSGQEFAHDLHLAVSPSGHGYLAGLLNDFEGDGGGAMPFFAPSRFLVHRFDADGKELWRHVSDCDGLVYFVEDIEVDSEENLYVSASSDSCEFRFYDEDEDGPCERSIVTIKYDDGTGPKWRGTLPTPSEGSLSVGGLAIDPQNNVYVSETISHCIPNEDCESGFISAKYDSQGARLWVTRLLSPEQPTARNAPLIARHPDGGMVISGSLGGDFKTVLYDTNGESTWEAELDSSVERRDRATDLERDAAGNVYLLTRSNDGETSDHAILKYDGQGTELWSKPFGEDVSLRELALDEQGNVYVTAWEASVLSVLKYSADGGELWKKPVGLDNGQLTVSALGEAHVGTLENVCSDDVCEKAVVTTKLDPAGETLWTSHYDLATDTYARMTGVELDSEGNVQVVGSLRHCGLGCVYSILLLKYGPGGNLLWDTRFWTSADSLDVASFRVDAAANTYVGGTLYDGGSNLLLLKFDSEGNNLWYDTPYFETNNNNSNVFLSAMTVDSSGNAYLAGTLETSGSSSCSTSFLTVKYQPEGNQLWNTISPGLGDSCGAPQAIFIDTSEKVVVVGRMNICDAEGGLQTADSRLPV